MNLFDIIGPVMVGPSSSHTAGAVRIGYVARKLLGEPVKKAEILLYGSFLATGKGHGTQLALVGGLLGMTPDDAGIPHSFQMAQDLGMEYVLGEADLKDAHPNSVLLKLTGQRGKYMEVVGESIGGGRINIASIDGMAAGFTGEKPTLMVHNQDRPGYVAEVSRMLSQHQVNIATMQLGRISRGGSALMVMECDDEVPDTVIHWLKGLEGIDRVTYYSLKEDGK